MATVFLAEELKHRRHVAIKVLDPELAAAIGPDRFLREIATLARLTHPNILPLHDSGTAGGLLYFVMPYIEGESLRARLRREPQLPVDDVLCIAAEVGHGLDHAHVHGVVHRDIKPENILLAEGHAVIADFGIAGALEQAGGEKLTRTGVTVGTPAYMSPEQVSATGHIDGRSDVYSLACMVHEMLCGQPPFSGPSGTSLAHQHLSAPAPPVSQFRPGLPAGIDDAIRHALAKTPADRPATAGAFTSELGRAVSSSSAVTDAPTVPLRAPVRSRRFAVLAAAIAGLAVVAAGAWWISHGGSGRIDSIAVMPLDNLSGDSTQLYFADGMTEELITELSKIRSLRVTSRSSVARYRNSKRGARQVGRELGVRAVVEGAVQRVGDRVRVSAQLVSTGDDRQLWADRYEREVRDVLSLQGELALAIAGSIRATLSPDEQRRMTHTREVDPAALDACLKGRYLMRQLTQTGLQKAIHSFESAIGLVPDYAPAWAGLAEAYYYMSNVYLPPAEAMPRVRRSALKALALDPELAEAHASLAAVQSQYDWDWVAAEQSAKRAIALNPSSASAHLFYMTLLSETGRMDEALAEFARVRELDPLSDYAATSWIQAPYLAGYYGEVITRCQAMLQLEPNYPPTYALLALCYLQLARHDDAIAALERAVAGADQDFPLAILGHAYAVAGRRPEAEGVIRKLQAQSQTRHVPAYYMAVIHVGLGDRDRTFEWLERAFVERDENIAPLKVDPLFAPLRQDPRFRSILQRMGLDGPPPRAPQAPPRDSPPRGS